MSDRRENGQSSPDACALVASVTAVVPKGLPPVHLWNPPFCGDIDMQILRDGTWVHEGGVIRRPELVRLFASILIKEDNKFFLVTPAEKVGITVEDAPFVAIDFDDDGGVLTFETNVGDTVVANAENPIRVAEDPETGEPSPYIHVRRGLEALIDRKSFYRLADMAAVEGDQMVVYSSGARFAIGPASE